MLRTIVFFILTLGSITALAQEPKSGEWAPPGDLVFRRETIYSEGVRMAAEVFAPQGSEGRRLPAIVMCHGWGGTAAALRPDAIAFARAGYFVVTFDYRGWGASDSRVILTRSPPQEIKDNRFTAEVQEVREVVDPIDQTVDLMNAVHWTHADPQCDQDRIGLWGSSFSGGHVVHVAARDARIKATVSQVPSLDGRWVMSGGIERATYGGGSARARGTLGYPKPGEVVIGSLKGAPILEKFVGYAPVEDVARAKSCAMLFIIAENEELFDNREHAILAHERALGPKKLVTIPGIKHYGIYREAREQAQRLAIAWFDEHLRRNEAPAAPGASGEIPLFNGKDLSGWEHFLVDDKARLEDVWSVEDGILVCKGAPMGYLATKEEYESFKLVVEWRWAPGERPGNSGVLMRITGKPTMLPDCMEAQLQSGNAGDIFGFQGFKIDGDKARRFDIPNVGGGLLRGLRKIEGNEKEPGEWNRYEITADGEKVTLLVNGKKVNEATGCDVRAGKIGLQSEGGNIHFRRVELTPLEASSPRPSTSAGWPHWRGPEANGVSRTASPPIEWSEGKNIQWKVAIDGGGTTTPIIWRNKVFLLAAIDSGVVDPSLPKPEDQPKRAFGIKYPNTTYRFVVICLDRDTGKEIWRRTATERIPHEGHHGDASFASASPATDGERLYCWFGSPGLFCYDLDGKKLWERDLGKAYVAASLGEGCSPVIHGGKLVIVRDHERQSKIHVLDAATGDTLWEKDRDETTAWATPPVIERGGRTQVITAASNRVRSYDLSDGEIIWQCGGLTGNVIPSPVVEGDVVYCMSGYRGYSLLALPLSKTGDLSDSDAILWKLDRGTPYVPSPLLYDGMLYFTQSNQNILTCVDAGTGKPILDRTRLPELSNIYASPVGADGRVYITSRTGTTLVLARSSELKVLSVNSLDDRFDASAALAGKQLFLRGSKFLYCIAESGSEGDR